MSARTAAGFRPGQWVCLTAALTIQRVVEGELETKTIPAGTVGIHHPLDAGPETRHDRSYVRADGPPARGSAIVRETAIALGLMPASGDVPAARLAALAPAIAGVVTAFHQVDASGFQTVREVALDPTLLEAVTTREAIPAPRLATMRPDWTPEP